VPEHFCWFIASSSHGCCWATVKPIFSARYCLLEISRLAGQQNHFQTDDSRGDVPVTTSFLYPLFSTLRLRCQSFRCPILTCGSSVSSSDSKGSNPFTATCYPWSSATQTSRSAGIARGASMPTTRKRCRAAHARTGAPLAMLAGRQVLRVQRHDDRAPRHALAGPAEARLLPQRRVRANVCPRDQLRLSGMRGERGQPQPRSFSRNSACRSQAQGCFCWGFCLSPAFRQPTADSRIIPPLLPR